MITSIALTSENAADWAAVAATSPDAWMFHDAGWLAMTERSLGLAGYSFILEMNGRPVGVMPLQMRSGSRVMRSSFFGTGGPALIAGLASGERRKFFSELFTRAADISRSAGAVALEVHLPPLSQTSLGSRWQVNPLVEFGYEDTSTHTWVADLSPLWDKVAERFSGSVSGELKKAAAAGYRIEQITDEGDMVLYDKVHRETCAASGIRPHPRAYFNGVFRDIVLSGRAVIWKAVSSSGEPVAFEMTARYADTALYWAGCCRRAALDTGVNYLLQTQAMRWAREQGCRWFENGEAFPQEVSGKLKGLTLFKRKFGGELHRYHKGVLKLGEPHFRYQALKRNMKTALGIVLHRGARA